MFLVLATSKSKVQMTECKIQQMFIYHQEICKASKNYSTCHFKVWIANDRMQDSANVYISSGNLQSFK